MTSGNNRDMLDDGILRKSHHRPSQALKEQLVCASGAHAFPSNASFWITTCPVQTHTHTIPINHGSFSFSFHLLKTATLPAEDASACRPGRSQKAEDANNLSLCAYPLKLSRSISLEWIRRGCAWMLGLALNFWWDVGSQGCVWHRGPVILHVVNWEVVPTKIETVLITLP